MALVKNPNQIRLGMIGMTARNGHPYSWSVLVNGRYRPEPITEGGYKGISDYLEVEPKENLGIEGVEVTHVCCNDRSDAELVAQAGYVPNVVDRPEELIGQVDAVVIATDIGAEHVERARPFIEADMPVFIDKPLVDNEDDLRQFVAWQRQGKAIVSSSSFRYAMDMAAAKRRIAEVVGEPRLITVTGVKKWETYGIHAAEAIYPLLEPGGWESVTNSGTFKSNIVHAHHSSGVDAVLAVIADMFGAFGLLHVYGTDGDMALESGNTVYMFRTQLEDFVAFLRTGKRSYPFEETVELMKIIIAGIRSREEGGRKVMLSEIDAG